jgi:hypothetical protein
MQNVKKAKNEVFEFKINDIWIKKVGIMGRSIFVSKSRLNAIKTQNKHSLKKILSNYVGAT